MASYQYVKDMIGTKHTIVSGKYMEMNCIDSKAKMKLKKHSLFSQKD